MDTFETPRLPEKAANWSPIMGFIMGESKFFSNFLSGLSHQGLPCGRVSVCMLSRGNFGHIWAAKLESFLPLSNYGVYYYSIAFARCR